HPRACCRRRTHDSGRDEISMPPEWTYAGTRRRTSLGAWRRLIQGPPRRGAHAICRIARSVGRGFPELHRAKETPVPRCLHSLGEFAECLPITLVRPFLGCLEFLAPP